MKGFAVVCLLAVAVVALATETETDVPTLPGLGSPCLPNRLPVNVRWQRRFEKEPPKTFLGTCVRDSACSRLNTVPGYCAGIGVTCCKNAAAPTTRKTSARPTLQSTASPCAGRGGVCKNKATCTGGTPTPGLCPGTPANVQCCIPRTTGGTPVPPRLPPGGSTPTPPSTGLSLSQTIPIPSGINKGLNFPTAQFQTSMLGRPGCPLTKACFSCGCNAGSRIMSLVKTAKVTDTVSITGIRPFVDAVKAAFDAMAVGTPDAQRARREVRTAGGLCCRAIKLPNGNPSTVHSNHSWGLAVDFYFGPTVDQRGDGRCQRGLAIMQPYFNAQGLYWAGGYKGATEDSMHFEASQALVQKWRAAKLI